MKRRGMWIGVGAALIVVAAALLAVLLMSPKESAEQRALAMLNVLASGDAEAIRAEWPAAPDDTLAALDGSTARISDPEIVSISRTAPDGPLVVVAYTLEGEKQQAQLQLTEQDGRLRAAGTAPFSAVSFDRTVTIGAVVVPAEQTVHLVPGSYDVRAAPAEFVIGDLHVQAQVSGSQKHEIPVQLSEDAAPAAQDQLDGYAAQCTASADTVPDNCGIALPWPADLVEINRIEYTVEQTPTISLTLDAFAADGGILVATVTGEDFAGTTTSVSYRTENWTLRGDVSFTDDDIVLSVW